MKMKRFFTFLFATMLAGHAWAYDFKSGDLFFNITSDTTPYTVEVVAPKSTFPIYEGYIKPKGDLVIPAEVTNDGKTYSVTNIGYNAFSDCDSLTSVSIPNSVTDIYDFAFEKCTSLTSIEIPNSVTTIKEGVFSGCSGLTTVTLPNTLKCISEYMFYGCSSLKSIVIPNSVLWVNESAFEDCASLTSVTIPNSVNHFGNMVFAGCHSLTSVVIPNSLSYIADGAFSGCSGLTSVEIANSVKSIGLSAFNGCSSLTSIDIPNSVTYIGDGAFSGCIGLTSIAIPDSVWYVGSTFADCSSLKFNEYDNGYYIGNERNPYLCLIKVKSTDITSFNINSSCRIISDAFAGCNSLTSVTIPNSVITIGNYAFNNCSKLTSIDIPNSVTSIGAGAFQNCSGLSTIVIPSSVSLIDAMAFSSCSNLTIYLETSEREFGRYNYWNPDNRPVVWNYKPTAVTESAANTVNIYVQGNTIVVENATEEIFVYNVMGVLVGRDAARHVSTVAESGIRVETRVNGAGVYIAKTGATAKRVVVN